MIDLRELALVSMTWFAEYLGKQALFLCACIGEFVLFFSTAVRTLISTRPKMEKTVVLMQRIGVDSLGIIILTGAFAGMVFALQTYIGFQRVGGEQYIGAVVALGMIRELGPVLT